MISNQNNDNFVNSVIAQNNEYGQEGCKSNYHHATLIHFLLPAFEHEVSNLDLPVTVLSHGTTSPHGTETILERQQSRDSSGADTPTGRKRHHNTKESNKAVGVRK